MNYDENQVIIWQQSEKWIKLIKELTNIKDDELPQRDEVNKWDLSIENSIFEKIIDSSLNLYIQAYHACRPIDPNEYYTNGIKVPSRIYYYNLLDIYCKKLNIKTKDRKYSIMREYIEKAEPENGIFFCLDTSELLRYASHYLIYGSELLFAAFVQAFGTEAYNLLEDFIGIQTIFTVNIPIKLLTEHERKSLCFCLLRNWVYFINDYKIQNGLDTKLHVNLPPEFIVNHFHPIQEVVNVHKQMSITRFKQG